jgi:serine protease Do
MGTMMFRALVFFAAAAGLSAPPVSLAQTAPPQGATQGLALSAIGPGFGDLAERLEPAVVAINAKMTARGAPRDSVHQGSGGAATGSGFVIDASGLVVTNNHVIEGATSYEVVFADGRRLPASLVGRDSETDLAVLRIASSARLASVPWGNSDQARIGDWAIAIGSPFGLGNSLSVGVISGRNRDLQAGRYDDFLQTDAAINRGNSGGPLFNGRGEVIGVNTAIVSPGGAQGGSVGVGFAVPSNLARKIVSDIVRTGSAQRGYIGLRARLLLPEEGGNGQNGVSVAEVAPNSPAARAGLRPGDRIFQWGGQAVSDPRALARFTAAAAAGSRVRLDGWRPDAPIGRQRIFANITIGAPQTERRPPAIAAAPNASALGLTLRAAAQSDRPKLPQTIGVVVTGVDAFGPGRDMVRAGDGLMEVQGRPVRTPAEARAALEEAARMRDSVVVRIHRDGQAIYRALRPTRR